MAASNGSDKLDQLYEHYNKLDSAKENIGQFEPSYLAILSSVYGSSKEKQLCSQFISKFFVHFPAHFEAAIDALLDLCEDDDPNIRRRAIKELPNICRDRKEFVPKIADVLAQLLLSEDQIELNIVNQALITLANYDIKNFLAAMFGQILEGEEETRDRVIKFLSLKFRSINPELLTKEIEEFFLEECKKVLIDVTKDEFIILMTLLSGLKISKTLTGHNVLLSIIKDQAELESNFIPSDIDALDKFLMCVRHGIPYFSQFSPSTDFVSYICLKIIPNLSLLASQQTGLELEVLQSLSEIIPFISSNDTQKIKECQNEIFSCILSYIPKPPEDLNSSMDSSDNLPSTQFSHVECLLFSLHQLCKFNPDYFTVVKTEEFRDFKIRLQYLARGVQTYVNKLKKVISSLKPDELKTDENKLKVVALKATTNINTLTKDFFKIPPSYKTTIQLSFKQQSKAPTVPPPVTPTKTAEAETSDGTKTTASGQKRPLITAPERTAEDVKKARKLYTPPGGKYSNRFKRPFGQRNQQGNFRFQNRGGMRRGQFRKRF